MAPRISACSRKSLVIKPYPPKGAYGIRQVVLRKILPNFRPQHHNSTDISKITANETWGTVD